MEFRRAKFRKVKPKYSKNTSSDARSKSSKSRSFRRPRDRGTRSEMHDATCGDCGTACKIPFEPRQGRAVLCDKCFRKSTPPDERRSKRSPPKRDKREKIRDKAFTKQKGYFEGGSEKFYGNLREKLFEILGGKKCVSCGFSDERALGFRDVKDKNVFDNIRRGSAAASWGKYISNPELARKNLKVLCMNCNQIRE